MSKLIKKVAQKITVEYCNLSIVENHDGFLTHDVVRNLLNHECGIIVVNGSNLHLRLHYELHYKTNQEQRFVYVCTSVDTILADMKRDAYICDFSVSDVFPLFEDKSLLKKQSYEVLEILFEQVGIRRVSMSESNNLVNNVVRDIEERKRRSAEFFNEQLQDIDIDWYHPAQTISSVSKVIAKAVKEDVYEGIASAVSSINSSFQEWVDTDYFATLRSNAILSAKSVNNILPHLARNYNHDDKIALLVVDGFSYWQYCILKNVLQKDNFTIEDGCTLAWMPSITMLSRQSIFRGDDPVQDYKQNPNNEKKLWFDYWQRNGFGSYELQYIYDTDEFAINEGVKRLAVVTVEMDEKMHSSTDYKDLYSLTENWCQRITKQIKAIVDIGYTLYLTTDHGSVLSHGWRTLTQVEKVFLYKDGSRGMRHLIFNNKEELDRFYEDNKELQIIKNSNWLAIRNDRCFAKEHKTIITHGGSHFMEMVVPLIKIVNK